jgi:hypothetical protein
MSTHWLRFFLASLVLTGLACNLSGASITATETPTPAIARTAELSELQLDVQAQVTSNENWQTAAEGSQIETSGAVKTGSDSRVRVDISDGSLIRLGADTSFTLLELSPGLDDPITRFKLEAGKVWIEVTSALGSGLFEIETPSGVSAVRGSLMSVEYDPVTGELTVTCLEGQCRVTDPQGNSTDLTDGEQSEIAGFGQAPSPAHPIEAAALAEWSQEFPEAQSIVAVIQAAATPTESASQPGGQSTNITSEGFVDASSTYSDQYSTSLAIDGDDTTSWFSAGSNVDGKYSFFRWTGAQDDLITSVGILSNKNHQDPNVRTGYGFASVTVQVLDSANTAVFEQNVPLDGTPDPDVFVQPNVVGRTVILFFYGHEAPDCGGFSELQIVAAR